MTRTVAPVASTPAVAARMRAQRTRDTAPELVLRRALHAAGLRYFVDRPMRVDGWARPIRPDVVFPRARLAVFVDGCFWHACPVHSRVQRGPGAAWWAAKLRANAERDEGQSRALGMASWTSLRVWEHDLAPGAELVDLVENVRALAAAVTPVGAMLRWRGVGFSCEAVWRVA